MAFSEGNMFCKRRLIKWYNYIEVKCIIQYIICFAVASHMASLRAQIINRTKVGQDMMIHEWKMGKMFRGYGAAIPEE